MDIWEEVGSEKGKDNSSEKRDSACIEAWRGAPACPNGMVSSQGGAEVPGAWP